MFKIQRHIQSRLLTQQNIFTLYLHEYQAYDLLKKNQVPLVPSYRASAPQDALAIAQRVMAQTSRNKPFIDIIIKAQIHAGGRGKGIFKQSALRGGVQTATKPSQVHEYAEKMLGKTLVTPQTRKNGKKVNEIFLVLKAWLRKQLYLSFLLDRSSGSIAIAASSKGGMNIQEVQHSKVHKFFFAHLRKFLIKQLKKFSSLFSYPRELLPKLYKCFLQNDVTLLEINPLGV